MKEYIVKGNAIEVTLDDGRVVKVAAKYIERMVDKLEIDEEEAILTWLEDEEYLTNDEQDELTEQAKENKSVKIIDAKADKPEKKTQKERTRKENPTKEMVIAKIAEMLPEFAENVVVENKGKESKYTLPREDINLNNSNTHTRGGGNIKNLYQELSKYAQIPEDVWEATAITGSFQNCFTEHYRAWLNLTPRQRETHPLNQLNEELKKQCGPVNFEFYHAMGWCKDNLMQDQYTEIFRLVVSKPAALTELRKCIDEIKKGGIKQPGLFIFSKLNKL